MTAELNQRCRNMPAIRETITANATEDVAHDVMMALTGSEGTADEAIRQCAENGRFIVTYQTAEIIIRRIFLPGPESADRYDVTMSRELRP